MELAFGQRISGLTADGKELHAAVFNENEVRAAAGLTMVVGAVAFSYAYFDANYVPLQVASTVFFVEFLVRLMARDPVQPDGRRRARDDAQPRRPSGSPPSPSDSPGRWAWACPSRW